MIDLRSDSEISVYAIYADHLPRALVDAGSPLVTFRFGGDLLTEWTAEFRPHESERGLIIVSIPRPSWDAESDKARRLLALLRSIAKEVRRRQRKTKETK